MKIFLIPEHAAPPAITDLVNRNLIKIRNAVNSAYRSIEYFLPIDPFSFPYDTTEEAVILDLPSSITAVLNDGGQTQIPTSWNADVFDGSTPGDYTFSAVIDLPFWISNPNNAGLSVQVTIQEQGVELLTIPDLLSTQEAVASYDYSSDELNPPPYAERLQISAGSEVGDTFTSTLEGLVIPNGAPAGNHSYRWYRSLNKIGSYEELIASIQEFIATENEVGWYLRTECDPKQADGTGQNLTGETVRSEYSPLITNPGVFSPFADITTWDGSFDKSTASNLGSQGFWVNRASVDGNASIGVVALPTWDAAKQAVRFTRSASQSLRVQSASSYLTPYEFWFDFWTPTVFTGTQGILGLSNSHYITITSAGVLTISGVSTGQTLTVNTRYRLRVVFNGASSSWTLNNGSATAISLTTASVGTPNYRVGCQFNDTNYFDGWINYWWSNDAGLSAGEITNMWTWFGL